MTNEQIALLHRARKSTACSHPRQHRITLQPPHSGMACGRCGHLFDPERVKAGRRASRRGKDGERRVKAVAGGERVGQFGGAEDNRGVLGGFTVQSKAGPTYWPKRIAAMLDSERLKAAALGTAGPAICFIESGHHGPNRKNRVIFVCDLDDLARFIESR